jgi:hypothetical protein
MMQILSLSTNSIGPGQTAWLAWLYTGGKGLLLSPAEKAAGDIEIVSVRPSVQHFCPEHISKSI